jgi:hypothetical protein
MKTYIASAAFASVVAITPVVASAAMFQPAQYARGTVTAVDRSAETLMLGGVTFQAESIWDLDKVSPGMGVTVTYEMVNGTPVILAVDWPSKNATT